MALVRLVHMASMARSGETMLLNALNKHSQLKIAGQLKDTAKGKQRLNLLKTWESNHIDLTHPLFADLNLREGDIVIAKQGVWEHPWPFDGFVLVRNPVSIYASLKRYDPVAIRSLEAIAHRLGMSSTKRKLKGNFWRFYRWFRDVDTELFEHLDSLDVLDMFCCFYNRRLGHLAGLGLPIVHYEQLVTAPEAALNYVCSTMSVAFESTMLDVDENTMGHGKNNLGRPISDSSLYRIDNLTTKEVDQILVRTQPTWSQFGYRLVEGRLELPNS